LSLFIVAVGGVLVALFVVMASFVGVVLGASLFVMFILGSLMLVSGVLVFVVRSWSMVVMVLFMASLVVGWVVERRWSCW
jgi:hypothetical protein